MHEGRRRLDVEEVERGEEAKRASRSEEVERAKEREDEAQEGWPTLSDIVVEHLLLALVRDVKGSAARTLGRFRSRPRTCAASSSWRGERPAWEFRMARSIGQQTRSAAQIHGNPR